MSGSLLDFLRARAQLLAIAIGFAALLVVTWSVETPRGAPAPQPEHGAIDLTHWNFATATVSLAGSWRYFDRRWADEIDGVEDAPVQVPGPWPVNAGAWGLPRPEGYGTYTLQLSLPAAPRDQRFAIDTGYILSAYRLYANGALIAESGVPAASAGGEVARVYSRMALLPDAPRIDLRLELSNHLNRYGGTFTAPSVGFASDIGADRELLQALSLLLVGAMLFAAAYHLVAFLLNPKGWVMLVFGTFAALLGLRTLLIEPLAAYAVPLLGQDWVWRIDYAASIMLLPAAYGFFALSFPRQVAGAFALWIVGLCGGAAAITVVAGPAIGELMLKGYEALGLVVMVYLTQAIIRCAWEREPGGHLALVGWLFSAGATVHDILLDNGVVAGINLIPFGFIAFFLCLSATLVARFSDAYRRTTELSREMMSANEKLEGAVAVRTRELSDKIDELDRNRIELERARSDAISANVAKSRFLATMSHELRTPLNSILGFSELIGRESPDDQHPDRVAAYAAHIHDSGQHLLRLISDILDLSKIEAGKLELAMETLDLGEVARDSLHSAATRQRRAADAVTLNLAPDLPRVRADRRAVMQMTINLLSNALKFTPPEGRITLSAYGRPDGGVSLEVADTGVGMRPEDIPKALAVFSQVDDGHARSQEGTGLGLPIVKALIELHGGALSLESERGRGTTVRLDFPPAAAAEVAVAAA